ncbi:hypothetical protein ACFS5N_13400 [Mucilaginibacter ximonensis]|uniref:NUMOD4 motif-containing protein n=1 Tax=Mucilaginibacter ximonensis TaxID=538021 RepID=A0ABW5YDX7_9SPHI
MALKLLLFNFVAMTPKPVKLIRPKGERLGWTPIEQVKHVTLKSITVYGRKVSIRQRQESQNGEAVLAKFLIP